MKNLTAVIISFLRPEYTAECVRSLVEQYPDIKILVGENGEYDKKLADFVRSKGARYFLMPFDSGVCYARNRLMELVQTEFVLVGDDDFFYTDEAKVDHMHAFLGSHTDIDLIGGRVRERGVVKNYQGNIDIHPDHLHYHAIEAEMNKERCDASGIRYERCDLTFNYFVARTERIRALKWDEKIKVAYEHSDWFISLKKNGVVVAYTPDAIVVHKPEHVTVAEEGLYKSFRHRRIDREHFFRKHGIKYTIGLNGVKSMIDASGVHRFGDPKKLGAYYVDRNYEQDGRTYTSGEIVWTKDPKPWMRPADVRKEVREKLRRQGKSDMMGSL